MIPNKIHFIFFGFTEFTRLHYWSIKSAVAVHKPEQVFLYYSKAPQNNKYWNRAVELVTLVQVEPPEQIQGVALDSYQYKADVLRLEILQQQGGIYLDIDVISLQPFGELLNKRCVLGIENQEATSITNAVIMAEPGHEFITEWLDQTPGAIKENKWANHAVCLPREILDSQDWDVHVEPRSSFMPFDFRDEYVFGTDSDSRLSTAYTMHLWETIWWPRLQTLSENSVLYQMCKHYNPQLKIAIYTISKNEAQHVDAWAATNHEADYRLVCDTGSSDNTVELLQAHGVSVVPIRVMPWRFDLARGTSLNLLPADIDVCIWQDLDERLLPGWRQQIEYHWQSNTTLANHKYRANDNPWQWHSKIHARHGCHWTGAVHETLVWHREESTIWLHDVYLDEHQDVAKDRSGYRDLLRVKIAEGDTNWRTYFFLANVLLGQESIDVRIQSYEACDDGDMVQSYIAKTIARGYAALNNHEQAQRWFNTACQHGNERETWFAVAEYWNQQKEWGQSYVATKRCLSIPDKRNGFTQDPRAWDHNIYDIGALAAYNLGMYQEAANMGKQAMEMAPTDQRLEQNYKFYQEALA